MGECFFQKIRSIDLSEWRY